MNDTWWPAAGYRTSGSGALDGVGTNGNYWSSSRHSNSYYSYYLTFGYNGGFNPSTNSYRSNGLTVRCVQEEGRALAPRRASGMVRRSGGGE